jgi:beta-xylosidase
MRAHPIPPAGGWLRLVGRTLPAVVVVLSCGALVPGAQAPPRAATLQTLPTQVGSPAATGPGGLGPWIPDQGDGRYRNPVLHADYSDPDAVRVGDDFYLVSSSFHAVPGIPVLHSRDLVNWRIVGHAVAVLPSPRYDTPQHGNGVWAPSLRYHDGSFWVFYGDPDLGIFMAKAHDPRGPWSPPVLVKEAKGWIDPCPLWDDDGKAYLVHAWAKSRVGFNGVLTVNRMSADGRRILDEGTQVFDGHAAHPTIEGPKFYKRNRYYYIFAPAGGVKPGWQTALRSRQVLGPYEDRVVLHQGATSVNGPHQGAWVDTRSGESWFLHFQDRGAYGRVVHLQPMVWRDDWPVIGQETGGDGTGEPVPGWSKPRVRVGSTASIPQTSDEFGGLRPGLQWQWNANPSTRWWSLAARPGFLRLFAQRLPGEGANLWLVPNYLGQKFPAPAFTVTSRIDARSLRDGDTSGLLVMGLDYAYLAVEKTGERLVLVRATCLQADKAPPETRDTEVETASAIVELRVKVDEGAICQFSFSHDGTTFQDAGAPFSARPGMWIGARVGLFAVSRTGTRGGGYADVDWFRIQ